MQANQFFSEHLTIQECMYWASAHSLKYFHVLF